jgi:hypothetical protein
MATALVRRLDLSKPPAIDKREPDPRKALATRAAARGHSLASLSAMIRRSPGYLGRFVREGVPAALSVRDHRLLADVMGVDERALGIRDLWARRDAR